MCGACQRASGMLYAFKGELLPERATQVFCSRTLVRRCTLSPCVSIIIFRWCVGPKCGRATKSLRKLESWTAAPAAEVLAISTACLLLESSHVDGVKMSRSGWLLTSIRPKRAVHADAALLAGCVASHNNGGIAGSEILLRSQQMVPATWTGADSKSGQTST